MRISVASQVFGSPPTLAQVWGETVELVEALWALDKENMSEEVSDVALFAQAWLYTGLGRRLDWKLLGGAASYAKFKAREARWQEIFSAHGLEFHPRFLRGGGNHAKPEKVAAALGLALSEQRAGVSPP